METPPYRVSWVYEGKTYTVKLELTDHVEVLSLVMEDDGRSKGLGDTVKKVIDKVTRGKVKPCGGCKKRQQRLNKLLPYKGDKNGR